MIDLGQISAQKELNQLLLRVSRETNMMLRTSAICKLMIITLILYYVLTNSTFITFPFLKKFNFISCNLIDF